MSAEDTPEDEPGTDGAGDGGSSEDVRERLEAEADRAVEQFDEGVVDLLSWILETETRARIYIYLRQHPDSTSDEIASGTGLYPSTVREALAALHEDGTVERGKRQSEGAGNNPYEYGAIPPSDLVGEIVDDVQTHLNAVCNLDEYLNGDDTQDDSEPVTITVTEETTDDTDESDGEENSTASQSDGEVDDDDDDA